MGYFSDLHLAFAEARDERLERARNLDAKRTLTPTDYWYGYDPSEDDPRSGPDDGETVEWVREPLKPGETEQELPF